MENQTSLNRTLPSILDAIHAVLLHHNLSHFSVVRLQFVEEIKKDDQSEKKTESEHDGFDDNEKKVDKTLPQGMVIAANTHGLVCRPVKDADGNIVRDAQGRPIFECS